MTRIIFYFFKNNSFKHIKITLVTIIFLIIKLDSSLASCFNYIPYAHNNQYTHLPGSSKFCVKLKNRKINYNISKNHSRRIYNSIDLLNEIYVFGDSQVLGIDWDEKNYFVHDLEKIYKTNKISIFAAPNNGPFQSINLAKKTLKKLKSNDKLKKIVFSFNYGNDVFRLRKEWELINFVPLKSNELPKIMANPILYDLVLLKGIVTGKYFSINLPDNKKTYELFKNLDFREMINRSNLWLKEIKKIKKNSNKTLEVVFFPPFWNFDISKSKQSYVNEKYYKFICKVKNKRVFDKIIIGKANKSPVKLTEDKRHFSQGFLIYKNFQSRC